MGTGGADGGDFVDDVVLDEGFVRAARRRELTASERLAAAQRVRSARERDAWHRKLARRKHRRDRRRRYARAGITVVVLAGLGAWAVYSGTGSQTELVWTSGEPVVQDVPTDDRPSPQPAGSDVPLRATRATVTPGTTYSFMVTQDAAATPVAYDPCRVIDVVVNGRAAPPDAQALLAEALDEMSEAAGLQFELEGPTAEAPNLERAAFQRDLYGDRWAPLLVAWSDPAETPGLSGRVAGRGGSSTWRVPSDGFLVYVSGIVVLDGPQLAEMLDRRDGRAQVRAVILHELGHVVGLGHVKDPTQLMNAEGHGDVTTFGAGDLSGLAQLRSAAQCTPEL